MTANQITTKEFENQISSSNIGKLFLDAQTADVCFVFEADSELTERIPAHKILLSMTSDVFKAMFYGELKESGDVKMVGTSADGFKEFLQFVYLNKVTLTTENVAE